MSNLACNECGAEEFKLEPSDIHGFGVRCSKCGRFSRWTGKPKEKKNNPKFRREHRKHGERYCDFCGISESEAKEMGLHFQEDHRLAEQFGGEDEIENVRPLCSACSYMKNALEHRTKAIKKLLEKLSDSKKMFQDYLDRPDRTIKQESLDKFDW